MRSAALVSRLRISALISFLERSVDLVAQHSYGLFQNAPPAGAARTRCIICRPIM
jgi:hypothetical protein